MATQMKPQLDEDGKGFAVEPIQNCPHFTEQMATNIENYLTSFGKNLFSLPCGKCNNKGENWICLSCDKEEVGVFCSRYVNKHMQEHNSATKHPIAMSFSDISFWCVECDFYITNYRMGIISRMAAQLKHGGSIHTNNLQTEEEKEEHFDSAEVLDAKTSQLADMIKKAKYFIAFTGAGISTSAGVPDFRSGFNTVLQTGPGAWEERAAPADQLKQKEVKRVQTLCALPTLSHMSLIALERLNMLKFLISQNTDGLHRRSGFAPGKLAELHGNNNMEQCEKCKRKYFRDFGTRSAFSFDDHITGRFCEDPVCGGRLNDSIINFGENLPEEDMYNGYKHSEQADLCLCLGSSLRVTPAAHMPKKVAQNGKSLVIINLQKTPLDKLAALRINGKIDDVMALVMQKLQIEVPEFKLTRRLCVKGGNQGDLVFQGVDSDGLPYSFLKALHVQLDGEIVSFQKEPFLVKASNMKGANKQEKCIVTMQFQGHYNEPDYQFSFNVKELLSKGAQAIFAFEYCIRTGKWEMISNQ